MEPPSASAPRWCVPWMGILLAVSLLTSWNPLATAKLSIVLTHAAEGKNALLPVRNLPEGLVGYAWYKGRHVNSNHQIASYVIERQENTPGPAHSGREIIHPNGSLLIHKVTLEDTGYYTLQIIKKTFHNEEVTGRLHVYRE
ncbi:Carcinoembryonic antigen-related cell adhesion molecule 5 [Pteropus alecto]|uniref:Carcinoembryonic antigen-related cell adhesion molecule 5 n=1 Tax=Pteropus alecto TaxID=9402 RepID=L5KQQ5_PTEAL|nr:Carcinoembryonic antigen-related cell adhesion molecule 5 [Pteropus alecto]